MILICTPLSSQESNTVWLPSAHGNWIPLHEGYRDKNVVSPCAQSTTIFRAINTFVFIRCLESWGGVTEKEGPWIQIYLILRFYLRSWRGSTVDTFVFHIFWHRLGSQQAFSTFLLTRFIVLTPGQHKGIQIQSIWGHDWYICWNRLLVAGNNHGWDEEWRWGVCEG